MIRVLVKPAKRLFKREKQWTWEIRGTNGELLDPRDTYNNREDAIDTTRIIFGIEPVERVVYDEHGNVELREQIRG